MKINTIKSAIRLSIALQMTLGISIHSFAQESALKINASPSLSRAESLMNLSPSEQIKTMISAKPMLRAGDSIVETSELYKIYKEVDFKPLWIESTQILENLKFAKSILMDVSNRHGLIFSDYWTDDLEGYSSILTEQNQLAIEILLTNAFLKISMDLSTGRIDPTTLDNDIRFKKKTFNEYKNLSLEIMSKNNLMNFVNSMAPNNAIYIDLLEIYASLKSIKEKGGFQTFKGQRATIALKSSHPLVPSIRERVRQHGYDLQGSGLVYDQELSSAVQQIQLENGYIVNQDLQKDSGFWGIMEISIDQRLSQVEASLEKVRWMPKQLEHNHIFVNTNSTEVTVNENFMPVNKFKTINGRVIRRTPMMKTFITHVIFNPRWTATDSIVIQDKLPAIQKDPKFLSSIRMKIYDRSNGVEVDPTKLDWMNRPRDIAKRNIFVMDPGPKNALGVFKFPLVPDIGAPYVSNADAIFMHFTDDPSLFSRADRHLSSGCVRLEKAEWLAGYLLKNNPLYSPDIISNITAKGIAGEVFKTDLTVPLVPQEYRAVYTVPLSVDKTASGHARFMRDYYLQDTRIAQTVLSRAARVESIKEAHEIITSQEQAGTLMVTGQPGIGQSFGFALVQKCEEPKLMDNSRKTLKSLKISCGEKIKINLNSEEKLPAGNYLVGFENTLYPGFVKVEAGNSTTLQLQKIQIPTTLKSSRAVRIYRDMTSLVEQKKVYFERYYTGKSFFREAQYAFGDMYVAGKNKLDQMDQIKSKYCSEMNLSKLRLVTDIREQAMFVCEALQSAQSMMDLSDLFRFASNGSYQEAVVDYPGDIFPKRYSRMLVSAPVRGTEFVSVMPGVYKIINETGAGETRIDAMNVLENYTNEARKFSQKISTSVDQEKEIAEELVEDTRGLPTPEGATTNRMSSISQCMKVAVWRTEQRSYCTADTQEGCDRQMAKMCSEIKLDLRFKR